MLFSQLLDTPTFYSIMSSQREFNALNLTVTTRMTPLCWDRIEKIILQNNFKDLCVACNDPRQEAHVSLVDVLTQLPPNALDELSLTNVNLEHLHRFWEQQLSIKKLNITGAVYDSVFLKSSNLTHLTLIGPKSKTLTSIIGAQQNLIQIKLIPDEESIYNDDVFNEIMKLETLEILDFPLNNNLSPEIITNLRRLRNLKKLSVSCSQACFQHLILAIIPSLVDLDIILSEPAPSGSLTSLAQNMHNLKTIKLKGPLVVNFLNDIALNWNSLESIWIENDESFFVNILSLPSMEYRSTKLKHLTIINHDRKVVICINDLMRFIKTFPLIETIVLTKFIEVQLKNFESILRHLPVLKELDVNSKGIDSTTNLMNIISEHGSNLKYVLLENFKQQPDKENLKVFFGERFPVIETTDGNLMLRNYEKVYLKKVFRE